MGFRCILEFNSSLDKIFNELKVFYNNNDKIKILRKKNNNYNAIHIYVSIDNFCLPWELQIWDFKDMKQNDEAHFKKYGRY